MEPTLKQSKTASWSGWIITGLVVLFLLVDAIMKVIQATPSMEGSTQLGWPAELVQTIGIILLLSTIIYSTHSNDRGDLAHSLPRRRNIDHAAGRSTVVFPVVGGVLVWVGLGLRDASTRALFFGRVE